MTHEEFMLMRDKSLRHGWVSSKDSRKAAQQKEREKEYNRNYYRNHSDKWNKKHGVSGVRETDEYPEYNLWTDNEELEKVWLQGRNLASENEQISRLHNRRNIERGQIQGEIETQEFKALFGKSDNEYINDHVSKLDAGDKIKIASTFVGSHLDSISVSVQRAMRKVTNKTKSFVNSLVKNLSVR